MSSVNCGDVSGSKHPPVKTFVIDCIAFALLIFVDLITKNMAVDALKEKDPFVLIPGVLEFLYLENRGAAFSLLTNHQGFFMIIASAAIILIGILLIKLPSDRHFRPLRICFVLIAAGAAGNLIDRITLNYVRDFIYFSLIDFPVFNVADSYVTVATVLIVILVLFYYKDDDFSFLRKH